MRRPSGKTINHLQLFLGRDFHFRIESGARNRPLTALSLPTFLKCPMEFAERQRDGSRGFQATENVLIAPVVAWRRLIPDAQISSVAPRRERISTVEPWLESQKATATIIPSLRDAYAAERCG